MSAPLLARGFGQGLDFISLYWLMWGLWPQAFARVQCDMACKVLNSVLGDQVVLANFISSFSA